MSRSFSDQDLSGAVFSGVSLADARFRKVDLQGARFSLVDLRRTVIRGGFLVDVQIDGELQNVQVNGVDIAPLVEAELDRRDPDRAMMRPADAAGFREAWEILERRWAGTVDRARRFPPEQLHERVDDEWSFIETLRHLVFATDSWVGRVILGDPSPWHPLSLPFDEMAAHPGVPWDREVRPSLDEVLALRADRGATVRRVLDGLTDDQLASTSEPVDGPGWPPPEQYPVRDCLLIILTEEYQHRRYAERDLDVLESRSGP